MVSTYQRNKRDIGLNDEELDLANELCFDADALFVKTRLRHKEFERFKVGEVLAKLLEENEEDRNRILSYLKLVKKCYVHVKEETEKALSDLDLGQAGSTKKTRIVGRRCNFTAKGTDRCLSKFVSFCSLYIQATRQ